MTELWTIFGRRHPVRLLSGVIMSNTEVRVNLEDLVPGMVLAEDAMHMNGRVLLSAGSCLTERHIKIFKTWGLMEAYIRGGGDKQPGNKALGNIDPEIVQQATAAVMPYFDHMDRDSEIIAELFKICVRIRAESMVKEHG